MEENTGKTYSGCPGEMGGIMATYLVPVDFIGPIKTIDAKTGETGLLSEDQELETKLRIMAKHGYDIKH